MAFLDKTSGSHAAGGVDHIQRVVLQRIRLLEYPPGSRLYEAKLAAEFGVSRTPIRETLNRLHYLGLVQTRNGVGTVVVQLSTQELSEIYRMRIEICPLIGRLSPNRIGEWHIAEARSLHERARHADKLGGTDQYYRINEEINVIVKSIIGNSALRATWDSLHTQASSAWHRVNSEEASVALTDELEDMITALEYGDADAVGSVQRVHIGYGFLRLQRAMGKQPATEE